MPGIGSFIWLFDLCKLYRKIDHVHVPTELGASLLRSHGYKSKLHVISNGYESRFTPKRQLKAGRESVAGAPFRIVVVGTTDRNEKEPCRVDSGDRPLPSRAGHPGGGRPATGPLKRERGCSVWPDGCCLVRLRDRVYRNADMPALLRSGDLPWCVNRSPISNR